MNWKTLALQAAIFVIIRLLFYFFKKDVLGFLDWGIAVQFKVHGTSSVLVLDYLFKAY
uniref:Uncharacterized protein n=1 Tax=Setaria italica TaxID=4555 RepID=K3ZPR6_SETIT